MHHPGSLAFAEGQLEPQLRIVSGFAGGNKPSADSALAGSRELPQGIGCISTIPVADAAGRKPAFATTGHRPARAALVNCR